MKGMMKDALILFVITIIAGGVLGAVYHITKEPIAKQKELTKQEAYKEVFANADHFKTVTEVSQEDASRYVRENGYSAQSITDEIVAAMDQNEQVLGYVMTVCTSEGYGGDITFAMGITVDGILNGISILSISETPGLGMKAEEVLAPQFKDKSVSAFEYTKSGAISDNQIDAISGATITTNAVVNGVNSGLCVYENLLKQGGLEHE